MYSDEFKLLIEKQGYQNMDLVNNNLIINNINYMHRYVFYLGNCYISRQFAPYCISSKGSEFLKFNKPFHFKSKKKKK
jgi:hypothetical protein